MTVLQLQSAAGSYLLFISTLTFIVQVQAEMTDSPTVQSSHQGCISSWVYSCGKVAPVCPDVTLWSDLVIVIADMTYMSF